MRKLMLEKTEFLGMEFNSMLASGQGRRLWATITLYEDLHVSSDVLSKVVYKVENLKKNSKIEIETESLEDAIEKFNNV